MSTREEIEGVACALRDGRFAANVFAARVHGTEARQLMAVVLDYQITALSRLRDQLLSNQPSEISHQKSSS